MRRPLLEQLLRELARVSGKSEVTVIGSQCVHAITNNVPHDVLISLECDILVEDEAAEAHVDAALGVDSAFHVEHSVYVDTVPASFPFLIDGWEQRATILDVGVLRARCLEVHDLAVSKLAAGRLKDTEMIAALVEHELVDVDVLRGRVGTVRDVHMRAILLARLQLLLEGMGR